MGDILNPLSGPEIGQFIKVYNNSGQEAFIPVESVSNLDTIFPNITVNGPAVLNGTVEINDTLTVTALADFDSIIANLVSGTTINTRVAAAQLSLSGTTISGDGTDANVPIQFNAKGTQGIFFKTDGSGRWSINAAGFFPSTDGAYDIGSATFNVNETFTQKVVLADGLVTDLAIQIGADRNNGFYGLSDGQLAAVIEGTAIAVFDATGIAVDGISERVVGVGVPIDGLTVKDGGVQMATDQATQLTSITTDVTLNAPTGRITTVSSTLAALASAQFTLTNSFIGGVDTKIACQIVNNGAGMAVVSIKPTAASTATVTITNVAPVAIFNNTLEIHFIIATA